MSQIPSDCRYTKEHEWVKDIGGGVFRVGITDYAQSSLGDIVYIDLPDPERELSSHEVFCSIESVKAVSDAYAPGAGVVKNVNQAIADDPGVVNRDPYGEGWLLEMTFSDPGEIETLLSPEDYSGLLES